MADSPEKMSYYEKPLTSAGFLPDLCAVHSLVTVLIVSQLLAFILVLASISGNTLNSGWSRLGLVSLFVHWVALSSLMVLCFLKKWLAGFTIIKSGVLSYVIILLLTFLLSSLVMLLDQGIAFRQTQLTTFEFASRNTVIAAIVSAIALRFVFLHHVQSQNNQAKSSARVQALQARIRPHFLFNSMNTIVALIKKSPDSAEQAVENLAELFRSSMMDENKMVTLEDELATARKYLQIEELRLGNRLKLEWQIEQLPLQACLPPLVLQPLFENAVYYGIEPSASGGTILVSCKQVDGFIELVIENPNNEAIAARKGQGQQLALANIKERLFFCFGRKSQIYLVEQAGLMRVILTFPLSGQQSCA